MKHTSGFTLVIVLILTSIASIVVLSSLKDTVFQERLSGNFQKKLNARLMSDKGVFASMEQLQQTVEGDPLISLNDLVAANTGVSGSGELKGSQFNGTIKLDDDGNIVVSSLGKRFEGENTLQAVFEFVQGSKAGPPQSEFPEGVTACSGVAFAGHGEVDSYDSSLGDYNDTLPDGSQNKQHESIVQTLGNQSEVTFKGNTRIQGNVVASGDLLIESAEISGNVHSNGNLTINNKSTIGGDVSVVLDYQQSADVGGSIIANGNIYIASGSSVGGNIRSRAHVTVINTYVPGYLLANQGASLNNADVANGVQVLGDFSQVSGELNAGNNSDALLVKGFVKLSGDAQIKDDKLRYATPPRVGEHQFPIGHKYWFSPYHVNYDEINIAEVPEVEVVEIATVVEGGSQCDPLNLLKQVDAAAPSSNGPDLIVGNKGVLPMQTMHAEFTVPKGSSPTGEINALDSKFLDVNTPMYYFNDALIKGRLEIAENHHVVMYINGDFTLTASGSITIPDNSSLTLIVKGKTDLRANSTVNTPVYGLTPEGRPVFSIYSSYVGADEGVKLSGGHKMIYAAVYAPYTQVNVTSNAGFKGSLLGETVTSKGGGSIHYDTALKNASFGGETGGVAVSSKLIFKKWIFAPYATTGDEEDDDEYNDEADDS
ncbi:polymer-forming cytoskeletal protein [Pseudoalteromonas sp.]|uniref:DUF7305 domain-containing protein n=1 Tax=Pseudoalteromonas sp. TaxID=53249 RepID=UPI00356323A4